MPHHMQLNAAILWIGLDQLSLQQVILRSRQRNKRQMSYTNMENTTMIGDSMCEQQSSRRTRPSKRGARRAVATALMAASVYSGLGVAGFSSGFRPLTSKGNSLVSGKARSPCHAVAPTLSTERLDTKHQGSTSGSMLDMNCQDQHEFELSVGHAMDTLRTDYPDILTDNPDFSIYDPQLEVIDPSGVTLHGVKNYKAAFSVLHALFGLVYCPELSGLTFRMCFDKARQNIRIHWNAQVIPKAIFGGYKTTLHVDGISVYEISRNTGNITQHRIERLVINDNAIAPEKGVFAAMRGAAVKSQVEGVPMFNIDEHGNPPSQTLQFQNFAPFSRSVLFSNSVDNEPSSSLQVQLSTSSSQRAAMESSSLDGSNVDWDALERKNTARKNFGLKPLTPEEFMALEEQVREIETQQQKRASAQAAEMAEKKARDENPGFFKKLFGEVLQDTCDSNYDCQRPEVCCDFGFKKMCCSSGMRVLEGPPRSRQGQLAEIPVIANPGPNYPPTNPRQGGNGGYRQY